MSLLLLLSCLPEIPVKPGNFRPPLGDADTDADADTDTDTDTDVVDPEECDNGKDDDGDGQIDCEDDDCLDACIEDCDDGKDNDQDGAADCDDDECAGDDHCVIVWDYALEVVPWDVSVTYGPSIDDWAGYGAAAWFSGQVDLNVQSSEGESYSCKGEFRTGPDIWDQMGGLTYSDGACGTCDWRFEWQPKVSRDTLEWWGDCPVDELPMTYLGFTEDHDKINAEWRGWSNAYRGESEWGEEDDRGDFYWGWFWDLEQIEVRQWQVVEPK